LAFGEVAVRAALGVVLFFFLPLGERSLVDVLEVLLALREVPGAVGFGVVFPLLLAGREAALVFFLVLVLVMCHSAASFLAGECTRAILAA
jgi:hypothetical protein